MDVIKIEDLEAYKLAEGITKPDKRCGTCGHHVDGRCMRIPYSNRIADGFEVLDDNEACTSWRGQ